MILWTPPENLNQSSSYSKFVATLSERSGKSFESFDQLYRFSIDDPETFWLTVWKHCGIIASRPPRRALETAHEMIDTRWFPDAELNFAENLLRFRDSRRAIIFWGEEQVKRTITYRELYTYTARLSTAMREHGVTVGDRVVGFLPNIPEAIVGMLATTSIGAIWSGCSPDFGVSGVVDRFGQIGPRVLLAADGYFHKGRTFSSLGKLKEILAELPTVETVVIVPYVAQDLDLTALQSAFPDKTIRSYPKFLVAEEVSELVFEQLPADHPIYILFSSGTTGQPKCIVHGAGGVLVEHLKELMLHCNLGREDRFFYQTTTSWMMWNWMVSGLATGATLMLYDGAPFHLDGKILLDFAETEAISVFGTSAKYLSTLEKLGLEPRNSHTLTNLRLILSTGSPLSPESFDFVYQKVKPEVWLASISGGTDLVGCFALASPALPVNRGELQCRSLGLAVEVFNQAGQSVVGEKGELVCTKPFPSMPVFLWNDKGGAKYKAAYFSNYPNIWRHGDLVELTESGGMIFYGRSDATLNPGGIRIGTAEIYRIVEDFPEVLEAVATDQVWDGDVRIVLFVKLRDGIDLDQTLTERICQAIKSKASPHHVPKKILQVKDIPRTQSGKIVELAVRSVIHEEPVVNLEAIANPEALEYFQNRPELRN